MVFFIIGFGFVFLALAFSRMRFTQFVAAATESLQAFLRRGGATVHA
jgi:hypothetical protein